MELERMIAVRFRRHYMIDYIWLLQNIHGHNTHIIENSPVHNMHISENDPGSFSIKLTPATLYRNDEP